MLKHNSKDIGQDSTKDSKCDIYPVGSSYETYQHHQVDAKKK